MAGPRISDKELLEAIQRLDAAAVGRPSDRTTEGQPEDFGGWPGHVDPPAPRRIFENVVAPTIEGLGGVAGFGAGTAVAPAYPFAGPAMPFVGSAVGYAAMKPLNDAIRYGLSEAGVEGFESYTLPSTPKALQKAYNAAVFDASISSAVPVAGVLLRGGKELIVRTAGGGLKVDLEALKQGRFQFVESEAIAARRAADKFAVPLSLVETSRRQFVQFFPKVLGRFPLIAPAFRKQAEKTGQAILGAAEKMGLHDNTRKFMELGPVKGMLDAGYNLKSVESKMFRLWRGRINRQYQQVLNLAKRRGAMVHLVPMFIAANRSMGKLKNKFGRYDTDNPVGRFFMEELEPAMREASRRDPKTGRLLPGNGQLSMERVGGLLEKMDKILGGSPAGKKGISPDEQAIMWELKEKMERGLTNINDPEVAKALAAADERAVKYIDEIYGAPAAEKIGGKLLKTRFARGRLEPKDLPAVNVIREAFTSGDKQSINALQHILGKKRFEETVAFHVKAVWNEAVKRGQRGITESAHNKDLMTRWGFKQGEGRPVDLDYMRTQLGLDNVESAAYQAAEEMMKGTKFSMEKIGQFIDVMEDAFRNLPPGVNTFIARGVTIAGVRRLMSIVLPTGVATAAGGGLGLTTGLTFLGISKGLAAIMTNPRLMDFAIKSLSGAIPLKGRQIALQQLLTGLGVQAENGEGAIARSLENLVMVTSSQEEFDDSEALIKFQFQQPDIEIDGDILEFMHRVGQKADEFSEAVTPSFLSDTQEEE
tara:strand:+ start:7738 stop:10026 length:2289 start_codon:yes stop_codon:yes gene_type:complete